MRVLMIEDDGIISDMVASGLRAESIEVVCAATAALGWREAAAGGFDAIILDRMLPDLSGMALLAELRRAKIDTPVLMLTALAALEDRVEGLEAGADDYLTKPFDVAEVRARLIAITRRSKAPAAVSGPALSIGDLTLDVTSHQALFCEIKVDLNRKQFSILAALMRDCDRIVTRQMLLEAVWGYGFEPTTNIVESNVSRLRSRLADAGRDPIFTIRGEGYMLRSDACHANR